jgi:hypothetical protein
LAMLVHSYSLGFILNDLEDGGSRVSDEEFAHLMHAMLSGVFDLSQPEPTTSL